MIDFHTHILPEIDDGSSSVKESLTMLEKLKEQGVNHVVLTPHFYAYSSSADNYKEIREKSLRNLLSAIKEANLDINLYMGSEVLYFDELWRIDNLKDLCIGGTSYMLLEMPFSVWTDAMIRNTEKLIGKGITPILAHFERYIKYKGNLEKIYELVNMGVILQSNSFSFGKFSLRRKVMKFLRKGMVSLLGTDCHNIGDRAPDYKQAVEYVKKKLSKSEYKRILYMQKTILSGAEKVYPE